MAGGGGISVRSPGAAEPSAFARAIRIAYLVAAWVLVVAIMVQVFFAWLAIFTQGSYWIVHRDFGYGLMLLPIAMLVFALVGRLPRRTIVFTTVLLALYFVQTTLPVIRDPSFIAAFHPVVALLLFGFAAMVAVRARAFVPPPMGTARAEPSASP